MTKKNYCLLWWSNLLFTLITLYKIQNISTYLPMQDTKIYFKI